MSQADFNSASPPSYEDPALYDGVLTRRVFAFFIDYLLVVLLCIPLFFVIFLFGLLTLGWGFYLFSVMFFLVAVPYIGLSLGGPQQATPGMRLMGVRLVRLNGQSIDCLFAILHGALFWAGNVLTPLILLAALFLDKKQTVHDWLLGSAAVRDDMF